MVHQGEGLALGLKPGDDLGGVHPGLDDLQGDLAPYGMGLLRKPDLTHAPFANELEQAVGSDCAGGTVRLRLRSRSVGVDGRYAVVRVVGHRTPPLGSRGDV